MKYETRRRRLSLWVQEMQLDALLISHPVDLFYLTGLSLSAGKLLISKDHALLLVDGRYTTAAQKQSSCPVQLSSIDSLRNSFKPWRKIGVDSAFFTLDAFHALKEQIPGKEWVFISKLLKNFRAVKDDDEIALLKAAAQLTWRGYKKILEHLKEGISEEDLAFEFEFFCRKEGASALSFPPIIAFGENSASPHHRAGKTKLQKNQIVLIDVGAVKEGYYGDMSRTLFFGAPDPQLYTLFLTVQEAQKKAIAAIRPGIAFGQIDKIARNHLESAGIAHLFTHGLSHGIGLEIHEYPSLKIQEGDHALILEPGMVFTIEPGAYLPGRGGVRIEDTVAVTEKGVENFFPESVNAQF
jgi:Xaa-Pro aminopeptidase